MPVPGGDMTDTNDIKLSDLRITDHVKAEEILELGKKCFSASLFINLKIAVFFINRLVVTGAYSQDRLVGFAFGKIWGSTGELCSAAVDPEFRRMGISKILLESLVENFKKHKCKRVVAFIRHNNSTSIAMSRSLGLKKQKVWSFPFLFEEVLPWGTHYVMQL
jgi:ribosomal protein S18 acetylase RimI-like enzyme